MKNTCSLLCYIFFIYQPISWADTLGVIYPEVRKPYNKIFSDIYQGIATNANSQTDLFLITKRAQAADLEAWQKKNGIGQLVVLGNRSKKFLEASNITFESVLYGAMRMDTRTQNLSGISLSPSPEVLFAKVKSLFATITNIHVVYEQEKNEDLIESAAVTAKNLGIQFNSHGVASRKALAKKIASTLKAMHPKKDALWISHNGSSIDKTILRQSLITAWNRNLIIFSSNAADVKRGALLAVYPDNQAMGKSLGQLAQTLKDKKGQNILTNVKELLIAINIRTAGHLGLHFSQDKLNSIDLIYPPK